MTEDEAKTKICCGPLLLTEAWLNEERIKTGAEPPIGRCIGSVCMAWRWLPKYGENPNNPAEAMSLPPCFPYGSSPS